MQLSKSSYQRSGAANGNTQRAAGARVRRKNIKSIWAALPECRRTRQRSGEKRAPKSIIQEGKKGIRGLVIVFMEIQAVTEYCGEMDAGKPGEFHGIIAGTK